MKIKNIVTVLLIAFILISCAPAVTPEVIVVSPTGTAIPTLTFTPIPPIPTSTPIPPIETLSTTKKSVNQFTDAMQKAGINITTEIILKQGLQIKIVTGADSKQYEIAFAHLDPDPSKQGEILEGDYPLMIKTDNEWKEATPAIIGNITGVKTGCFYGGSNGITMDEIYKVSDIINSNFNVGGVWAGMTNSQPTEGKFDYRDINFGMGEAKKGNLGTIIHPILWGYGEVPAWIKGKNKEQLLIAIYDHVASMVSEIKRKNDSLGLTSAPIINVVNEPKFRDYFWQIAGKDYVKTAVAAAAETYPEAIIIISSFDNETTQGSQYSITFTLADELKEVGLDGIGVELAINGNNPPTEKQLLEGLQSYTLPVYITESVIKMGDVGGENDTRLEKQGAIEFNLAKVIVKAGNVKLFTTFQLSDDVSIWNDPNYMDYKPNNDPALFDLEYKQKVAYYSLMAGMLDGFNQK
jgi:GH35 family endo-1,4-beta-xylanase